ncbi:SDR family NAD(P)-dependent oxidoreductase [Streptomyces rimosus]|uniref:SDR family NAD(P)-dependent oxidoreductase n=1 Tax=Streptomyces rimosus TaxID=1927 RepID=UPI0004C64474|nr:SDR family NAD(P)-dependent oxidoreductase [Streptomyces rimosus]
MQALRKTLVVTGGTDGLGKALADAYLRRGHEVLVVGRNAAKGDAWLNAARRSGAGGRAHFLPADLSLVAENRRVAEAVRDRFAKLDALVLCARHYRSARLVTPEGFESTFAHFYLSRYVLSHTMAGLLETAARPVVLNVAGPGDDGPVRWDDLEYARGYDGGAALAHAGRLNDLLGAGFPHHRPGSAIRYVLYGPGVVGTSFSGQYTLDDAARVEALRRTARPVAEAVAPMLALLDEPPTAPVSAFVKGEPIDMGGPGFSLAKARRLHRVTGDLLAAL